MDKITLELFTSCNELCTDEKIVYAGQKNVYVDEIDEYESFYRVVTINERTGIVNKYIHQGVIRAKAPWFKQTLY